jgi:hypothetical protein
VVEVHLVEVRLVEPQSSLGGAERHGKGVSVFGCGVLYGWEGYGSQYDVHGGMGTG